MNTLDDERLLWLRPRQGILLAQNPNYFGNLLATKLKPVEKVASNSTFEELTSVGYNPRLAQLYATFDIKRAFGYSGDLCSSGSHEYVRFYVNHGGGFVDVGLVGTDVHDIPVSKDCAGDPDHPLSYSVQQFYSPPRRWCFRPQLPMVRAILSWNVIPPPNQPNWVPVFGGVQECAIQIEKSYSFSELFTDKLVLKQLEPDLVDIIKASIIEKKVVDQPWPPIPVPDPGPELAPLSLASRIELYHGGLGGAKKSASEGKDGDAAADEVVSASRFAFPEIATMIAQPVGDGQSFMAVSQELESVKIDLSKLVAELEDTKGNVTFEELVDLGLDYRRHRLDATYILKKSSGFSGNLCTAGSNEHVSFWADWADTCQWEYLGTVSVKAYDFARMPGGHLCYTASLPVDLDTFMQPCGKPRVGRVRAVLSWSTPPSTTDPDQVPYWGNRLDTHVLVPPVSAHGGQLAIVGGVGVADIDATTGLTLPSAKFALQQVPVDSLHRPCPFGGWISVQGQPIVGAKYKLHVRDSLNNVTTLSASYWVVNASGVSSLNSPDAGGWFTYLPSTANEANLLGGFYSSGNDRQLIELEIQGVGVVDTQRLQMDNLVPSVAIAITTPGNCQTGSPGSVISGTVSVHDAYPGDWSVVLDGGPPGFGPLTVLTGVGNTPPGQTWSFSGTLPDGSRLVPCGYVARVQASDRAVVHSQSSSHTNADDVGFSVV